MIETKQNVLDIKVDRFQKPQSGLLQDYGQDHAFWLKLNHEDYEHIWHYQELYEKSHYTIKSIEAIIKSIVIEEMYSKLKPCYRKRDDDL